MCKVTHVVCHKPYVHTYIYIYIHTYMDTYIHTCRTKIKKNHKSMALNVTFTLLHQKGMTAYSGRSGGMKWKSCQKPYR